MADAPEEIFHHGQGVSNGVVYGPAYVITADALRVPQRSISEDEVEAELSRFEDALAATRADIERVKSALVRANKGDEAAIFDSHILILEDEALIDSARRRIRDDRMHEELALSSPGRNCLRGRSALRPDTRRDARDAQAARRSREPRARAPDGPSAGSPATASRRRASASAISACRSPRSCAQPPAAF